MEAGLRLAARAQSETDLLFDLRIWSDRPVCRTAGLRPRYSRGLGLRHGPSLVPARAIPAGLLWHLPRRCRHRRVCIRSHFGGLVPAARQSERPAHRRFDARIDAEPDLERTAVVAIRGGADPAADVRARRNGGWLCDASDCEREDV